MMVPQVNLKDDCTKHKNNKNQTCFLKEDDPFAVVLYKFVKCLFFERVRHMSQFRTYPASTHTTYALLPRNNQKFDWFQYRDVQLQIIC